MKLPRNLSGKDLVKALTRLGYVVTRQKGSHIRLMRAAANNLPQHHITVPDHDELKVGLLAGILDDIAAALGITRDDLMKQLFG